MLKIALGQLLGFFLYLYLFDPLYFQKLCPILINSSFTGYQSFLQGCAMMVDQNSANPTMTHNLVIRREKLCIIR